jgi:hypothetical protein
MVKGLSRFLSHPTDEQRAEEEVAFAAQQRIAAATQAIDQSWMDGLGELPMRVDPEVYFPGVEKETDNAGTTNRFVKSSSETTLMCEF